MSQTFEQPTEIPLMTNDQFIAEFELKAKNDELIKKRLEYLLDLRERIIVGSKGKGTIEIADNLMKSYEYAKKQGIGFLPLFYYWFQEQCKASEIDLDDTTESYSFSVVLASLLPEEEKNLLVKYIL
jgi:hypothetical protein